MSWGAVDVIRGWWKRLNPEASSQRMALSFAVLAGGTALAILGVTVVAFGDLFLPRPSWIRELGFVAAAGGLPVFVTGLAMALPSRWWERTLVAGGLIATTGALALFVMLYPDQWHLTVQSPNIYAIGSYVFGMTMLAAGTAGCLGTYLIESAEARQVLAQQEKQREYSDEEIMHDLRWAEKQGWTWGGVLTDHVDEELRLQEEVEAIQFKGHGPQYIETVEAGDADVHNARSLANLQGIQPRRTDDDVDAQVGNLKALKEQKRAEEAKKRDSWAWKLTHPFQWLGGS